MFFFFLNLISSKIEITFSVKYTASCPLASESFMVIDEGKDYIKPPRFGKTYYRFNPGKHFIQISHPWCTFYNVSLDILSNGKFVAHTNNLTIRNTEIPIRHLKNADPLDLFSLIGPQFLIVGGIIAAIVYWCKKTMNNPEMQEKMREQQELMMQQQKAKMEEMQKAKGTEKKKFGSGKKKDYK